MAPGPVSPLSESGGNPNASVPPQRSHFHYLSSYLIMKRTLLFAALLACLAPLSGAAAYPHGVTPTGANVEDARQQWLQFKSIYVTSLGTDDPATMMRVTSESGDLANALTSEVYSYGLIACALFEENDTLYRKFWNHLNAHLSSEGLVPWRIRPSGSILAGDGPGGDNNSDAAISLDLAAVRWGGDWPKKATDFIRLLRKHRISHGLLGGGYGSYANYIAPAYYPRFALRSGDFSWPNEITDNSYALFEWSYQNLHLLGWFLNFDTGQPASPDDPWASAPDRFDAGPTRSAWRLSQHYLTTGDARAKRWADKFTEFFRKQTDKQGKRTAEEDITVLRSGYKPSTGAAYGRFAYDVPNPTMIAAAGVAAMASGHQAMTDQAYQYLKTWTMGEGSLSDGICLMAIMIMSGAFDVSSTESGPWYPEVTLLDLTDGQQVEPQASLSLSAAASDGDGHVTQVEFFSGHRSLGSVAVPPYTLSWSPAPGIHRLTARATDDAGLTEPSAPVVLFAGDPWQLRPFHGTPIAVPGKFEAEHFDLGGPGVSWFDGTEGNQYTTYPHRADIDPDVQRKDGLAGDVADYCIANTLNASDGSPEWVEYSLEAPSGGILSLSLNLAVWKDDRYGRVLVNGLDAFGSLNLTNTGGYTHTHFKPMAFGKVHLPAGRHLLRLVFEVGGWNVDWLQLQPVAGTPRLGWLEQSLATHYPWIYHFGHGWLCVAGTDDASVHLWHPERGWLWSGEGLYPFLYRYEDQAWLWYDRDGAETSRYYNFTTMDWE